MWSDKYEYIWGRQDKMLYIGADLKKTWSQYLWFWREGTEKEFEKSRDGRENRLAATVNPRDVF